MNFHDDFIYENLIFHSVVIGSPDSNNEGLFRRSRRHLVSKWEEVEKSCIGFHLYWFNNFRFMLQNMKANSTFVLLSENLAEEKAKECGSENSPSLRAECSIDQLYIPRWKGDVNIFLSVSVSWPYVEKCLPSMWSYFTELIFNEFSSETMKHQISRELEHPPESLWRWV